MNPNRISTNLIFLAGLLLVVNLAMAYFVFIAVRSLEHDAWAINHMGVVRGSIQRITKLELADADYSHTSDLLIKETDALLNTFLIWNSDESLSKHLSTMPVELIRAIHETWRKLKADMIAYRARPDKNLYNRIIGQSEKCWQMADTAVLTAQFSSENKVSKIELLYFFLAICMVNTVIVIAITYRYVRKNLEYMASYDALTGLLNRHSYDRHMDAELDRSKRYHRRLSLILFDIDHFKAINDTYGHKQGDQVLVSLSKKVRGLVRKHDLVCRVGGEEFAIIVPETGIDSAVILAEKIREAVAEHFEKTSIRVTISIGVAEWASHKSHSDVYRQADFALYAAKQSGRNRVERYVNSLSPPLNHHPFARFDNM